MENKFETLMVEQDAAVATIYLNRPGVRNAFSEKMLHELLTCFAEIKEDSSVRAVIITGREMLFVLAWISTGCRM